MIIEIKYSKYIDLIFHTLAYLKVNNASNLYDNEYIVKMTSEKNDFNYNLIPKINLLYEYYNNNFERLMLINFLPFFCDDNFDAIKDIFLNNSNFTQDDIRYFIKPFIEIMNNEALFFFKYWDKLHKNNESLRNSIEKN